MAVTKRRRRGSWLMLGIGALGVLGLFAMLIGGLGAGATGIFSFRSFVADLWQTPANISDWLLRIDDRLLKVSLWLLVGGAAAVVVSLLLQLMGALSRMAGRRNLVGVNSAIQVALCVILLLGINAFSFSHYHRFDWTGKRFADFGWRAPLEPSPRFPSKFTLPAGIAADLKTLREPTTIIVYQLHKTFGQLSDKPDAFDYAAEDKVVEKVHDLVQLFREFGPQFHVEVLDVKNEEHAKRLKQLTTDNPKLAKSIETAPENSIFFHARRGSQEAVQRISFNDFYQLDKSASKEQNNLVLLPQGIESFARRVLAIEEKKPRIGLAVIHEVLTTQGSDYIGFSGLKKSLEDNGFEVTDIILKKLGDADLVAAAYTLGESQVERWEEELLETNAAITINRQELNGMSALVEKLKSKMSLDDLNRELRTVLRGQRLTERDRQLNILRIEPQLDLLRDFLSQQEKERDDLIKQLDHIPNPELIAESRRISDIEQKLSKLFANCDLIILPRLTLMNIHQREVIEPRYYGLDKAQERALRRFLVAGKPVLALFGPTNEPPNPRSMGPKAPDNIEALFAELGILFGNQTILFNNDVKAFAQRRTSLFTAGSDVEPPPPVQFDKAGPVDESVKPNPIAQSMKIVAGAAGSSDKIEKLRLRHPRPVYFLPIRGPLSYSGEFLFSEPLSWNEADPFPSRDKTPRYEPSKPDDPKRSTRDEERRASFPIGVAIETTVPSEWRNEPRPTAASVALMAGSAIGKPELAPYLVSSQALMPADQYKPLDYEPTRIRVAAIGHGGLFTGSSIPPAREQLLLHTCNWLLNRDERLPNNDQPRWQYPRVQLSERRAKLWRYGTLLALPATFGLLGAMVLLVRKYR